MSVSKPSTTSSNQSSITTDSYNTTNTVNRVFDNVGNTQVYFNSPNQDKATDVSKGLDNKTLLLVGGVAIGAIVLLKK